jgi:hypothetical protein
MSQNNDSVPQPLGDENQYSVIWSSEDNEYVATTPAWPSLSWLDTDKDKALEGLKKLVEEVSKDFQ